MNFDHYTDCTLVLAVDLVNTPEAVEGCDSLLAFLKEHEISGVGGVAEADVPAVAGVRDRLQRVFDATDVHVAASILNTMLAESGALPQLTDHDGEPLHLHFNPPGSTLGERIAAEAAMGLAVVLRDEGLTRLRSCASPDCGDVFVDTSRNRSRRFCGTDCGNRVHVAAHRARQRAAAED